MAELAGHDPSYMFTYVDQPIEGSNVLWGGVPALGKWYICGACHGGDRHHRLSIDAKFCSECGVKIEWPERV